MNNWSDSRDLTADARYTEKNVPLLVARGGPFSSTARCARSTSANRSVSIGATATARCSIYSSSSACAAPVEPRQYAHTIRNLASACPARQPN